MHEGIGPYLGVLIAIWIASVGFPMPEDIALLGGGLACYKGWADLWLMILVAMFAVLSGDLFIYFLGHRWASSLLEHRLARVLATPERIEALKQQFHRHQLKTIFVARFLPGMRAVVFLTAGAVRISVWKFLAANGSAALISVPVFVVLGFLFGHSFDRLKEHVEEVKHFLIVTLVLAATVYVLWLFYSRSAKAREARRLLSDRHPRVDSGATKSATHAAAEASRPREAEPCSRS
ncbi:MAG: DedA family protein [Planctomycetes bacterium]|nr:DedA family protein [Planctomycetota bacterium]